MPEVVVEPVFGRDVQKTVDLVQNLRRKMLRVKFPGVQFAGDFRQTEEDAVFADIAVDDQLGSKMVQSRTSCCRLRTLYHGEQKIY